MAKQRFFWLVTPVALWEQSNSLKNNTVADIFIRR
jgi:hypothetical protein